MKTCIVLFFLFVLAGCATTHENVSLYDVYVSYKTTATHDNILSTYPQYFSPRLVEENIPDESAIPFLLFTNKMAKEGEHYSKMLDPETGCLTVEGHDSKNGEPIEFNILYVRVNHTWYIDETNIRFLAHSNDYSKSAKCPSETMVL